jgi:8-oxo-dGTP pyrophosphatase MutT (NUDIX family)
MKLLTEIFHQDGLNIEGKVISREAVRGIIFDQKKLLMILSDKNGDYKFPGGGVKQGENPKIALIREVQEESGAKIEEIDTEFGKVIEYDIPLEKEYDVFKMTSSYYICKIGREFVEQQLDHYEKALGFVPCWIDIEKAITTNRALLREGCINQPRWVKRETTVLEHLKRRVMDQDKTSRQNAS